MYELYIKTKFNEIKILVEDTQDTEVKEILNQPWVEEVRLEPVEGTPKVGYKKLIRRKDNEKIR